MRYRLVSGKRKWPWRLKRDDAIADAIKAGDAIRDEHTSRIYWHPLARIEQD